MNIAAKKQLYAGFHRVLHPGGRLCAPGVDGRTGAAAHLPNDVGARCGDQLPADAHGDARGDRGGGLPCRHSMYDKSLARRCPVEVHVGIEHKGLLQRHDWTSYEELRPDSRTTKPVSV